MSDNKKSILDFVNRSNQQMAARRKQQQQDQEQQQQSNSSSSTSHQIPQQLTPAQQMQQKQQTGSTVMNTNDNRFSNTTSAQQHQQSSFYTSQNFYGVGNNLSRADSMMSSSTSSATNTARERAEKTRNMLETWADKIEAFVNDGSQTKLEMPTLLSGADRRELHQLASKFNLSHSSVGVGTQRRLVITKDALFFQGNLKGVGNGAVSGDNAAMTATTSSLIEQQTKSRGQVRRERQEQRANQDEKDLYADKNAIKAFRKYQKHVDSHANAVALAEDDILLQEDEEALLNSIGNNNNNDTNEDDEENENNAREQLHQPHHEARRRPREDDEDGNNKNNNNEDDINDNDDAAIGNDEHPAVVTIPEPEYMSTEQIEEACRVNEISEDDIEWIRTFSEEHSSSQQKETENVVFCIDFSDFVSSCTALARIRALSNGKKKIVIVELTAEKQNDDDDDDSSCSYKCMKNQFEELLNFAKSSSSSVDQDEICLSLPGMSLFGEALKIAVAIPVDSGSDAERLASALGNKYGSASVRVV